MLDFCSARGTGPALPDVAIRMVLCVSHTLTGHGWGLFIPDGTACREVVMEEFIGGGWGKGKGRSWMGMGMIVSGWEMSDYQREEMMRSGN